jgi:hypothetical protein
MKDKSLYLKLISEKKLTTTSYIAFFIKYQHTSITTTIKANKELTEKGKEQGYNLHKNFDRDENSIDIGFNIMGGLNYIVEFEYYLTTIKRDKELGYINYNHTINLDIMKPINKNWFAYVGGKIMYRQFNGDIPYLYNKYSQTTFDHKYGFARVGIGVTF